MLPNRVVFTILIIFSCSATQSMAQDQYGIQTYPGEFNRSMNRTRELEEMNSRQRATILQCQYELQKWQENFNNISQILDNKDEEIRYLKDWSINMKAILKVT